MKPAPGATRRIEDEMHCLGFYGFGGGVAIARGQTGPQGEIYCGAGCTLQQACWEAHRARVKELAPAMVAEFERLVAKHKGRGDLAAKEFYELHRTAEAYAMVMMGNIEDGAAVGHGARPKERGPYTLPFPFTDGAR